MPITVHNPLSTSAIAGSAANGAVDGVMQLPQPLVVLSLPPPPPTAAAFCEVALHRLICCCWVSWMSILLCFCLHQLLLLLLLLLPLHMRLPLLVLLLLRSRLLMLLLLLHLLQCLHVLLPLHQRCLIHLSGDELQQQAEMLSIVVRLLQGGQRPQTVLISWCTVFAVVALYIYNDGPETEYRVYIW